jgi:nucleosome binding factor SPN SPT16 subunit
LKGKRIGCFPLDKYTGDFIKYWNKAVVGFDKVDASSIIASILAIKDDEELYCLEKAARFTSKIFLKCLKPRIASIIYDESKIEIRHSELSRIVVEALL